MNRLDVAGAPRVVELVETLRWRIRFFAGRGSWTLRSSETKSEWKVFSEAPWFIFVWWTDWQVIGSRGSARLAYRALAVGVVIVLA